MPWRFATSIIASMFAHCPKRWTGIIAFVRGVMAFSRLSADMLKESSSMSAKTGTAPARHTHPAVFGFRLGLPAAVAHIYLPPRRCRGMPLTGTVDLSHIGDRNRLLTFRLLFQRHALVLFHQSAQNCTQYHIIARAQNAGKNQSSALIGLIICSITQSAGQSTAFPCEN